MQKDFDEWNLKKQQLDALLNGKLYHERDIWWCGLGINIGSEENGTGKSFDRPVLVLKGISKNSCYVVPLTTSERPSDYKVPLGLINQKNSYALIGQMKLVDTRRFINKLAVLDTVTLEKIRKAIKDLL